MRRRKRKFLVVCSGGMHRSPVIADYLEEIARVRGYNYEFRSSGSRNHSREIRNLQEKGYEIISVSENVTRELSEEHIHPDYQFPIDITQRWVYGEGPISDLEGVFNVLIANDENSY